MVLVVGARTVGGSVCVYPNPGFVIFAVPLREPFETGIVAEAVVPTPTPTDFGAEIETVTAVPT